MKLFDGTLLKMSCPTFGSFIKLTKLHSTGSWVSTLDSDGMICFGLSFEGILETGGSLEQPVIGGLIVCRYENVGLHIHYCPEEISMSPRPKSGRGGPGGNFAASSVATFLDLVLVTLQRDLMASGMGLSQGVEQIELKFIDTNI